MKVLLVTFIIVAAIAVNICDTNAFPQPGGGELDDHHDWRAERKAPVMEGQFIEMLCVSMGQLSNSKTLSQNREIV